MVAALPGLLGENPTLAVETNFGFEILKNRSFLFMLLQILCLSNICLVSKIKKTGAFSTSAALSQDIPGSRKA